MAGPVAHIFCALMVLQSGALKVESEKEFIIGTSFPDIRYLAKLTRKDTHKKATWTDVKNAKTDFEKGMYFHCLLDDARIQKVEIACKKQMPYVPVMGCYLLKCFEDIILYDRVQNWPKILSYFDEVLQEQIDFGVPKETVQTWHTFIKRYCSKRMSATHMQHILDSTPHFSIQRPIHVPAIFNKAYLALIFYRYGSAKKLVQSLTDFYDNITANAMAYQPYAKHAQAKLAALLASL